MTRRAVLIAGVVGALLSVSLAADAQRPAPSPRVGFLAPAWPPLTRFFESLAGMGLRELGYVDGRNITLDRRFAAREGLLADLATELVERRVDLIVAAGTPAILAARQATKTIPVVMVTSGDPVAAGLVARGERLAGNLTGVVSLPPVARRLELLKAAVPAIARVALVMDPAAGDADAELREMRAAAAATGVQIQVVHARTAMELEAAVTAAVAAGAEGLIPLGEALSVDHGKTLAGLAGKRRLAIVYPWRWVVHDEDSGALLAYGPSALDLSRRTARFVDRILKGARPAELPVETVRFELVVNLKTARGLGLTIPPSFLLRADQVRE